MRMNYSKFFYVVAFATVLFTACGNDSSTSANNSNDGEISSKSSSSSAKSSSSSVAKSSSSRKTVSSSSGKVAELVDPADVIVGSMKDSRDGQKYKTVKIGSQTWMAQNLNYETANSYCYNDVLVNCSKYGRLYTWAAAMDSAGTWNSNGKGCGFGKTCSPTDPVRGVCPEGWHLPTESEWKKLFASVGGFSTAGKDLKSTSGWTNSNNNGTDAFSFSALPAGGRYYDVNYNYEGDIENFFNEDCIAYFYNEGNYAFFWSSTEYDSYNASSVILNKTFGDAGLGLNAEIYGFSVRCLKDSLKSLSSSVAKSSSSRKTVSSSSGKAVDEIVGSMMDSRDGQKYKTVKIGKQTWMAQNLNYKTANSYCYNDASSYCAKYGRLYTWDAAVGKTEDACGYGHACSLPSGNIQGACPAGWHLPTESEWETLFTAVGGQSTAGKVLKSTSGWNSSGDGTSGNGTDAFSFSALPVGSWTPYTENYDGGYDEEGYTTFFWSPTEYDSDYAYYMSLNYLDDVAYLDFMLKNYGNSVRCLKD